MYRLKSLVLLTLSLFFLTIAVHAEEPRILKVLPHYLDLKGRNSLGPSLYERDAYQAYLRDNPALCSGMRFDIQWKGKGANLDTLKARVEMRGVTPKEITVLNFDAPVSKKTGWFSNWTSVTVAAANYRKVGELAAWRVTLWDGDKQVSEQKSFLWD